MAQLKWNEISAPHMGTAIQGLNVANSMIGSGLNGLAAGLGEYGDQGVLAQLAKYNDPNKLNADVQSGAFDTSNASKAALGVLMQRPGQLIGNQQQQQVLDTAKVMDPLKITQQIEANRHAAVSNPITEANANLNLTKNQLAFDRSEQERAYGFLLDQDFAKAASTAPWTPETRQAFVKQYEGNPVMQRMATQRMQTMDPEFGKGIQLPSGSIGAPMSGNFTLPAEMVTALSAQESALGIPSGVMSAIAQKEVGGRLQEFINDPAKYHYEIGSDGKRKSTAFGPFGILESTAEKPGYGVKPLQNKSLPEQIRFASEYAAARVKAEGGNWEKGLDMYGTGAGTGYGASIMSTAQAKAQSKKIGQDSESVVRAQDVSQIFGDTSTANRMALAYKADPQGSKSAQEMATELTNGSLKGLDINDVRGGIEQAVTELGVSPAVAAALVQESVSDGFMSGVWGVNKLFDKQVIDMDKLGAKIDQIAGKKVDGKRPNIGRFNTVFDALTKQAVAADNKTSIESSAVEAQKVLAQYTAVQNSMSNADPAKAIALANLSQQYQTALAQGQVAQQGAMNFVNTVIPPVQQPQVQSEPTPVATQPSSLVQAKPRASFTEPKNSNFYSADQAAERAKKAAERNQAQLDIDLENAAKEAQKEIERKRNLQRFASFREQAAAQLPR